MSVVTFVIILAEGPSVSTLLNLAMRLRDQIQEATSADWLFDLFCDKDDFLVEALLCELELAVAVKL